MKTIDVEVWIVVDSCGDSAVGTDAHEARERFEENVQNLNDAEGFRMVKVIVKVPLPEASVIELEASAPAMGDVEASV